MRRLAGPAALAAVGVGLAALPAARLPAFYESFLYLVFHWVALATSWSILSGFSGYFSFGHGAFFGAGMYATATLATAGLPFLATLPLAGLAAALFGVGMGAVVFRVRRLRGELFALLTLAVTFVLATIVLNTPDRRRTGRVPERGAAAPPPRVADRDPLPARSRHRGRRRRERVRRLPGPLGRRALRHPRRRGRGGGPGGSHLPYKLRALGLSAGLAGVAGGIHAMFVTYVTVAETFSIVVPLYVILMSVVGGARHWLGPAIGAAVVTVLMYGATGGQTAVAGRAMVGLTLMLVILFLPDGITGFVRRRRPARSPRSRPTAPGPPAAEPAVARRRPARAGAPLLVCADVRKAFRGVQALGGVSLEVREGEILGLVGPNGSGKSTLINVVSGHHRADGGRIVLGGVDLTGREAYEIARLGVSRTYQIPRPFGHLTVRDNVAIAGMFGRLGRDRRAAEREAGRWLEYTGLADRAGALPATLNLHQRKFLELARALASEPRLVMLDEVLSGLTPSEMADRHPPRSRHQGPGDDGRVRRAHHAGRHGADGPRRRAGRRPGHRGRRAAGGHAPSRRRPALPREGPCSTPSASGRLRGRDRALGRLARVGSGELVSVIGPNGSGKTTLMNAIAGLLRVRAGRIRFHGEDSPAWPRTRSRAGGSPSCPRGGGSSGDDGGGEPRDRLLRARRARRPAARASSACTRCSRSSARGGASAAGTLSGGQQQMVALGRALMAGPRLLLLDEPSLGLAPSVVDDVFEAVGALHRDGVAVLLVEQNVARALAVATRAYVLAEGRIVAEGPAADLLAQPHVRSAYLGDGGL